MIMNVIAMLYVCSHSLRSCGSSMQDQLNPILYFLYLLFYFFGIFEFFGKKNGKSEVFDKKIKLDRER
jgi:hypothetical protein